MFLKYFLPALIAVPGLCFSQNIPVTFTCSGEVNSIDSVMVTARNLTTNQTLTFPGSATLILSGDAGAGILPASGFDASVYPNPFAGNSRLRVETGQPGIVGISVHDLAGRKILERKDELTAGSYSYLLGLSRTGIFMVTLTFGEQAQTIRVVNHLVEAGGDHIRLEGSGGGGNQNTLLKKGGYALGFHWGDVVLYKCVGGDHTVILAHAPATSSQVRFEIEFIKCQDKAGRHYPVVKIGNHHWMAENLGWLPEVHSSLNGETDYARYYVYGYEGDKPEEARATDNYKTYGVLYNFKAAWEACPQGWHLPTREEWNVPETVLGFFVGGKMKESGTAHWVSPNNYGSNESGFTGLPGGCKGNGMFEDIGQVGRFWTSSVDDEYNSWSKSLWSISSGLEENIELKRSGYAVRCVKNYN
jgi:uncharacterized protein (TIGR02145 family)